MKRRAVVVSTAGLVSCGGCVFTDGEVESDRGELEVVVNGSAIDLTADRFQAEHADNESVAFHLHERDEYWYMEGDGPVTFAEGIALLPRFEYSRRDGDHVVTVDGTVYDAREPTTEIDWFVDGESVDPTSYELRDGDQLRLEISTRE